MCCSSEWGGGRAGFPSEKYHSNGGTPDGVSREFMLFSQNTIESRFSVLGGRTARCPKCRWNVCACFTSPASRRSTTANTGCVHCAGCHLALSLHWTPAPLL